MKNYDFKVLFVIFMVLLLNSSCSSESDEPEPMEEPEVIVDTHSFIALRNDGQLFEIGSESGRVIKTKKVNGVVFNTNFNSLTASTNTRIFYEQIYDPVQGFLYVLNQEGDLFRRVPIELPEAVFGPVAGIVSLDWYETGQELLGFVKDYIDNDQGSFRLVGVNIETFNVTDYGEIEDLQGIRSTTLVGTNLYISSISNSYPLGFRFQVFNVIDKSLTTLPVPDANTPPILLSNNTEDNNLFGFIRRENSNIIQAADPIIYSADFQSYEIVPLDVDIALINVFGKSFYDSKRNQHITLVATLEFYALLKYNIITHEVTLTPLKDYDELSSLIGIIDVK